MIDDVPTNGSVVQMGTHKQIYWERCVEAEIVLGQFIGRELTTEALT